MINHYEKFLDKLKAINILCEEFSKQDEEISKDTFGNILNHIIAFKQFECELNSLISSLENEDNLNPETKESLAEANQSLIENKEKIEKRIGDNKLLNKAYSKIEFIMTEDCLESDERNIKLNIDNEASGLIRYVIKEKDNDYTNRYFLHRKAIILESLVISLCTYLETFISCLTKDFYLNIHKGNLYHNKSIDFKQLKEIGSIEEARIFLIESELETLFRKGFHTWFKDIDNNFNIKKNFNKYDLDNILNEINELYLRRNLYVHADGKVNDIYLMHAPEEYTKGKYVGNKLVINKDYINKKIYMVEKIGAILFYSYSLKKHKDKDEMFYIINDIFLKEISNDDSNDVYSLIYNKLYEINGLKSSSKMIAKINYFLAFKLRGEYNLIEKEIQKLDLSAYSEEFKRAKKIIMTDEDAVDIVVKYFKEIEDDNFLYQIQWPLYNIIRDDEKFDAYVTDRLDSIFS
jgi:hypothetical protein